MMNMNFTAEYQNILNKMVPPTLCYIGFTAYGEICFYNKVIWTTVFQFWKEIH